MSDPRTPSRNRLDAMLACVPAEVVPPDGLWKRIEAALVEDGDAAGSALRRVPPAVEPPRDLWPAIRAELERSRGARGSGAWQRAAAAVGAVTVVAKVGLAVLRLDELVDDLPAGAAPAVAAAAGSGWPGQLEAFDGIESAPAGAALRGALATIRNDYEMTQRQRLAIEAQMRGDLDNTNLQALWRHTYAAELALTTEAERILENLR